ncbi:MAG: GNAT family N-acetyltransferase [Polyangiaceae bacterium]|nr:GNAT family N-acetyltransferase [Polyangiaceae bacterium]
MSATILSGEAAAMFLLERRDAVDAFAGEGLGKEAYDITGELERPYAIVWAAAEGADALGFLLAAKAADELHVIDVVVAETARRRGIGRALVDAATRDAASQSFRLALLEVRRSNLAAIRLYRQAGFVGVRVRPKYYDSGEDGIEMAKEIAPGALAEFERLREEDW